MSEYRNRLGPIPDRYFENDTDPDAGKGTAPDGFEEKMLAKIRGYLKSSQHNEDPQEHPEQPVRSKRVRASIIHEIKLDGFRVASSRVRPMLGSFTY